MIKRKRKKIKVLGEYVPVYKNGQISHLVYVLVENLE